MSVNRDVTDPHMHRRGLNLVMRTRLLGRKTLQSRHFARQCRLIKNLRQPIPPLLRLLIHLDDTMKLSSTEKFTVWVCACVPVSGWRICGVLSFQRLSFPVSSTTPRNRNFEAALRIDPNDGPTLVNAGVSLVNAVRG